MNRTKFYTKTYEPPNVLAQIVDIGPSETEHIPAVVTDWRAAFRSQPE